MLVGFLWALCYPLIAPRGSGRRYRVVVHEEDDGKVTVGFMDPVAVLKITDDPRIAELARKVRDKLERLRDKLAGGQRA